ERTEMAARGPDASLHHRKIGDTRRSNCRPRLYQNGDVEMVFEQPTRFDRLLIAAIYENDPVAVEAYKRNVGHRLGSGGNKRRDLWTGSLCVLGPAGGLANIGIHN